MTVSTKPGLRAGIFLSSLILLNSCSRPDIDYFPLEKGMYWRYIMTYKTMDGNFKGIYAVENLGQREINNRKIYVRQLLDGSVNYIQVDESGVQLESREKTVDLDTLHTDTTRYIFRYPLRAGTEWQDTISSKVLIKTGPPQKTEFHIATRVPVDVRIESMTDTVKVPAGIFHQCMRITLKGSSFTDAGNYVGKTVVRITETNWYAPGVGLVKSIREESTKHKALDQGEIVLELEKFR